MRKLSLDIFKREANIIFNNKYDYSKSEYKNSKSKIKIICPFHGEFEKTYNHHIRKKQGCPKCSLEEQSKKLRYNKVKLISELNNIHSNKYDYSKLEFKNLREKVLIGCPTHGFFEQTLNNHKQGYGCRECCFEDRRLIDSNLKALVRRIRANIKITIKNKGFFKKSKTSEILGCTWEEFKDYLEDNPYGFKIDQEGLDLDHIVPISSAKTEDEVIKLNHYTNFQLLPSEYNQWIKSCKLFNKDHFEEWFIRKYSYDS